MDNIKILKVESKTTKTDKPYKMCEVECNGEVRKVNIWSNAPDFANLKEGSIIVAKMTKEGQYWNISFENEKPRGGAYKAIQKADIAEAQQTKAKNIAEAQDRSAWMWAKTNASTILTSPQLRDSEYSSADEMVEKLIKLATKIYNAEPLEPF